jgi:cell division protein FtsZ
MSDFEMMVEDEVGAIIKVIGVGGAGGNAVNHMVTRSVQGVEFIAINTDRQALASSLANTTIQLGEQGLGAGANPNAGRIAAEAEREQIKAVLQGSNMVFITAGMGKGTGTGASPVVAQIAKEMGILTVGVVTKPFGFEGNRKMQVAEAGIDQLVEHVDSLIVVLNQKLFEVMDDDAALDDAFIKANDVLNNAVAGIAEIINVPGLINVDFADVRTIMSEQGKAMMGIGEASGLDRARLAAEQAVASPLLDGVNLQGARGVIVNITSSRSLKLRETNEVVNTIKAFCADDATIIHGTVYNEDMGDTLRVTVVATGIGAKQAMRPQLVAQPMLRTGTDNMPVMAAPNQQGNYNDYEQPAIWRNARGEAAARVAALEDKGMERLDIPAFLRKQAD